MAGRLRRPHPGRMDAHVKAPRPAPQLPQAAPAGGRAGLRLVEGGRVGVEGEGRGTNRCDPLAVHVDRAPMLGNSTRVFFPAAGTPPAAAINSLARAGYTALLRRQLEETPLDACDLGAAMVAAAQGGHVEAARALLAAGAPKEARAVYSAFLGAHRDFIAWVRDTGFPTDASLCAALAAHNLESLRWGRAWGAAWDSTTIDAAACYGNVAAMEWALTNGCPFDPKRACSLAARTGQVGALEWIYARSGELPGPEDRAAVVWFGWLPVMRWMHARVGLRIWLDPGFTDTAVDELHLDALRWAASAAAAERSGLSPPGQETWLELVDACDSEALADLAALFEPPRPAIEAALESEHEPNRAWAARLIMDCS